MIDKVLMRILMVLGIIFLITLIDTTYDYKRKVSDNRYDVISSSDGTPLKLISKQVILGITII